MRACWISRARAGSMTCWPRFFALFFVPFLLWDFTDVRVEDLWAAVLPAVWLVALCFVVVWVFDEVELEAGAGLAGAVVDVADAGGRARLSEIGRATRRQHRVKKGRPILFSACTYSGNRIPRSRCQRHIFSFAPPGLVAYATHGLRRGLHSSAASRLSSAKRSWREQPTLWSPKRVRYASLARLSSGYGSVPARKTVPS